MSANKLRWLLLLACALRAAPGIGAEGAAAQNNTASGDTPAYNAAWLRLLHYEADEEANPAWTSAVTSDEFFLHPDGRHSPQEELQATIAGMRQPVTGDPNTHVQCRYPARRIWIHRHLPQISAQLPEADCFLFNEWKGKADTRSISFVFATGFLANPASFFGHILLKFNTPTSSRISDLLDVSVNYGAIVPDNVNPVSYIYNGAFGGYQGGFSHIQYFQHHHNYGETEQRDLWEYELNLSPEEVDYVTAHAFELLGRQFRYFFFRENCSYRMAKVLEILDGVDVTPRRPWTIPQEVIQHIAAMQRNGQPLLAAVHYRPSRQSRFYARYAKLTGPERQIVGRVVADPSLLQASDFRAQPEASRIRELDALIDYYQFRISDDVPADHPEQQAYRAVLKQRFLQAPARPEAVNAPPRAPHQGRPAGYVAGGALYDSRLGAGLNLAVRGAYYDALDGEAGQVPHSALTLMDTRLDLYADRLRLRRLDIFHVESVSSAFSGLPGDDGRAWQLGAGLVQQHEGCADDCLVFRFQGAMGRSFRLKPGLLSGAYLGGSLQNNRNGEGYAIAYASLFGDYRVNESLKLRATLRHSESLDGDMLSHLSGGLELRYRIGQRSDVRFGYSGDGSDVIRLSTGYYW